MIRSALLSIVLAKIQNLSCLGLRTIGLILIAITGQVSTPEFAGAYSPMPGVMASPRPSPTPTPAPTPTVTPLTTPEPSDAKAPSASPSPLPSTAPSASPQPTAEATAPEAPKSSPAAVVRSTPAASPTPMATPTPPQSASSPEPAPRPMPAWLEDVRRQCDRHYPGRIQAGLRRACFVGGVSIEKFGALASHPKAPETSCRLQYGEEPSETLACLIGTRLGRGVQERIAQRGKSALLDLLQRRLQLCSESFSVRNDLDASLLESCLAGAHASELLLKTPTPQLEICARITPDPSFVGPCQVGVALAADDKPAAHLALCDKYFDRLRFHVGYRSCVNAGPIGSSLVGFRKSPTDDNLPETIRKRCDSLVADAANDHERGACVVGAGFLYALSFSSSDQVQRIKAYERCGAKQVTFEDRDFLGCLTAASLLDLSDGRPSQAGRECSLTFRSAKSLARSACLNSVNVLPSAKPQ